MPLTINELVVTVEVAPSANEGGQNASSAMNPEVLKTVIEQVMEVLNNKSER